MKQKNRRLITLGLFFCLPQFSFADYNLGESSPPSTVTSVNHVQSMSVDNYVQNNNFKVLSADNYYKPLPPSVMIHDQYQRPEVVTETMRFKKKIEKTLSKIDMKKKQSELALKEWKSLEPKISKIIKKEKELDELLDYMVRLKKVTSKRKQSPNTIRDVMNGQRNRATEVSCNEYSWPKKCS